MREKMKPRVWEKLNHWLVGRVNHVIDMSVSLDCGEKVNRVVEKK